MKISANQSLDCGDDREKPKPHHGGPSVNNSIEGKVSSRSTLSRTLRKVLSKLTDWMTASPRWSSRFKTSSNSSRVTLGEVSETEVIWFFPSQNRLLLLSWLQKTLDFPLPVPPQVSWRSYLAKISSRIRSYNWSRIRDRKVADNSISDSTVTHGHSV